jgi:hypothetical protein
VVSVPLFGGAAARLGVDGDGGKRRFLSPSESESTKGVAGAGGVLVRSRLLCLVGLEA